MKQVTCWGPVRKGAMDSGLIVMESMVIGQKLLQGDTQMAPGNSVALHFFTFVTFIYLCECMCVCVSHMR